MNQEDEKENTQAGGEQTTKATSQPSIIHAKNDKSKTHHSSNPGDTGQTQKDISKWARFKTWIRKTTFAEWGMLAFTLAITGSSIAYTHYTRNQLKVAGDQLRIAQDTYNAANRPYVGIEGWALTFYVGDKPFTGPSLTRELMRQSTRMVVVPQVKNFGQVPGTNFVQDWDVTIDGVSLPVSKLPDRPSTIFPSQVKTMRGTIAGPLYAAIKANEKILKIEMKLQYDGPSGHYKECTIGQYAPDFAAFYDLGPCPF